MEIKEAIEWLESVELFFINKNHYEDHHIPEKLYHTKIAMKKIKKTLKESERIKERRAGHGEKPTTERPKPKPRP